MPGACRRAAKSDPGSCRPSGFIPIAGEAFWLGGHRHVVTMRVWVNVDVIHLLVGGAKVKSVPSHLTVNDQANQPSGLRSP